MFELDAPPQSPWAVQILTTDYLIDGWMDGARYRMCFNVTTGSDEDIFLASTRVQPTGPVPPLPAPISAWTQVFRESVVAIIPRDEPSLAWARKWNADWRIPIPAEAFVGPYVIRGAILSTDRRVRVWAGYKGFVAQDVEIECRLLGANLPSFKAPYVVVGDRHRHLLRPLP